VPRPPDTKECIDVTNNITYGHLGQLLSALGFDTALSAGSRRVYRHAPSDTLILLPDQRPEAVVRPTDLLSVRHHLVYKGHLDDNAFDVFVTSGELPVQL